MKHTMVTKLLPVMARILALTCEFAVSSRAGGHTDLITRSTVLAHLGNEHFCRACCRHVANHDTIVAWGDRILEWTLPGSGEATEVAPTLTGQGYSNGGCMMDLDGDGTEELILARGKGRWSLDPQLLWFRQQPGRRTWMEHSVAQLGGPMDDSPHDMLPIFPQSATGKSVRGVVVLISRHHLVWYEIPPDPQQLWKRHEIATFPAGEQHSGLAIGDIAGHGRQDIVCGQFWVECPSDPQHDEPWILHRYGSWNDKGWEGMDKLAVADIRR